MTMLAGHRPLLLVLGAGLAWRLVLAYAVFAGQGYATDLGLFWQWATALAHGGPGAVYAGTGSVNYPPLYLYVLWAIGAIGQPALLKLPPILADVGIAALVYALAARWRGPRVAVVAAALFLFLPVAWYDSALWGQVDAVGTLVVLAALLLLVDGWSEAALVTAVLAVLVKPQYAIGLGVVLPVLVRRHLLRPGSGPRPRLGRVTAALNRALGGLLAEQGPRRLAGSVVVAGVVAIVAILPFDIEAYAPASLAGLPVIGQVAGLVGLFGRLGSETTVLTANAFNPWALAGTPPLAQTLGSARPGWVQDTTPIIGDVTPVLVGAGALAAVGLLVAGGLLLRDGIVPILLGFTVLALAFFVLPTRVHERYLFPFFATASVLAAPSAVRIGGLAIAGGLATVNMHAILAGNVFVQGAGGARSIGAGGFGGFRGGGFPGSGFTRIELPWGELARSEAAVTAVAVGLGIALLLLLAAWIVVLRGAGDRAAARPVPATG